MMMMIEIKARLTELIPEFKSAIIDLMTSHAYGEWAKPFIVKIASICLPNINITFDNH